MKFLTLSIVLSIASWGISIAQEGDPESPPPSRAIPVEEDEAAAAEPTPEPEPEPEPQPKKALPLIPLDEGQKPLPELPENLREKLIDDGLLDKPEAPEAIITAPELPVAAPEDLIKSDSKLHLPFLPKPIQPAPLGWTYRRMPEASQPWQTTLELADGSSLALQIRPFKLAVPSLGGANFSIQEPGFKPELAYQQTQTIGSILTRYDVELEATEKDLNLVLRELDEILASLPSENPQP